MSRKKKTHCKRGHPRTPDNLDPNRSCRICDRAGKRRWARKYREENLEKVRASYIASNSGLDKEVVYQYLLDRKDIIICDICQQECPTGNSLAVDHDHETNEIRGLLCVSCNTGLGKFKDSVKLMEVATEYLRNKGIK